MAVLQVFLEKIIKIIHVLITQKIKFKLKLIAEKGKDSLDGERKHS